MTGSLRLFLGSFLSLAFKKYKSLWSHALDVLPRVPWFWEPQAPLRGKFPSVSLPTQSNKTLHDLNITSKVQSNLVHIFLIQKEAVRHAKCSFLAVTRRNNFSPISPDEQPALSKGAATLLSKFSGKQPEVFSSSLLHITNCSAALSLSAVATWDLLTSCTFLFQQQLLFHH